jgi:hypothetical protein
MRFVELNPVDDIEFGDFNNKKIGVCMSVSKKPIKFQIPRMYMPFGVSGFTPAYGPVKYNVDFSMKGWDEDENYVNRFYTFVRTMEDKLVQHVADNSIEIFGKQLPNEEIHGMLNSNIKESSDREPKFRLKIDQNTKIFDVNDADITAELDNGLYSRHSGVAMVELGGVYFMNKMFGITWKMSQMKTYEPQRLKGFQFQIKE